MLSWDLEGHGPILSQSPYSTIMDEMQLMPLERFLAGTRRGDAPLHYKSSSEPHPHVASGDPLGPYLLQKHHLGLHSTPHSPQSPRRQGHEFLTSCRMYGYTRIEIRLRGSKLDSYSETLHHFVGSLADNMKTDHLDEENYVAR